MDCPECAKPRAMGYEERGVYDGVLIWLCEDGHAWSRFPERAGLHEKATEIIEGWKRAVMTDNEWYAYMYEQALDDIYAEMNDMYLDMQAEPPVIEDEEWEDEYERAARGDEYDRY